MMQKISNEGICIIKNFEGLFLRAYRDIGGVWTIGWGTTENVHQGMKITKEEADNLLRQHLVSFEKGVNKYVTVKLNQNEFDALVSFAYNVGLGALRNSTLLKLLNRGNKKGAAYQFLRWNRVHGKRIKGLVRRRNAEMRLFLKSVLLETVSKKKMPVPSVPEDTNTGTLKQIFKYSSTVKALIAQISALLGALTQLGTNPVFIILFTVVVLTSGYIFYRKYTDEKTRF